jgi:hypothetical protein
MTPRSGAAAGLVLLLLLLLLQVPPRAVAGASALQRRLWTASPPPLSHPQRHVAAAVRAAPGNEVQLARGRVSLAAAVGCLRLVPRLTSARIGSGAARDLPSHPSQPEQPVALAQWWWVCGGTGVAKL